MRPKTELAGTKKRRKRQRHTFATYGIGKLPLQAANAPSSPVPPTRPYRQPRGSDEQVRRRTGG